MDYFRWQPAPSVPAIQLRWSVMEGIEGRVIEGFKALPRRGAEVGGALLGYRDPATGDFTIEGFEPIPVEYESGPSSIPSERDAVLWRERIAEMRQASPGFIGIYRSQTRPGLLVMPEDCAMVERFLPREEGVLLLVKPLSATECVGAFFLCDGGAVLDEAVSARQFPLRKPEIVVRRARKMSVWIPISAAVAGIAVACLFHYGQDQAAENPLTPPASAAPALVAPAPVPPAPAPHLPGKVGNPINSSSDRPIQKPVRRPVASPPAGDEFVPAHRFVVKQGPPPGRVKRTLNNIRSKASHLWPFRQAKPARQTQ